MTDFLEKLCIQIDSAEDIEVKVLDMDKEHGLMSVEVNASFPNAGGNVSRLSCVKTCLLYTSADIDTKNARDFKESIVDEIENSNFSPTVIAECRNAGNSKYTVTVDEYKDNENNTVMAEVTVSYNYSIPFLNVNKPVSYTHLLGKVL